MRILFLTDIHDDFQGVETVLLNIKADLYLLAGDLIYRIFATQPSAWRFLQVQQTLSMMKQGVCPEQTMLSWAQELTRRKPRDPLAKAAREYLKLSEKARDRMLGSYRRLSEILKQNENRLVRVLPGNYDMDLAQTPLSPWSLHMRSMDLANIRIAGYGGAQVVTPGVPEHLQVSFKEKIGPEGLCSEPLEFFRNVNPDVLVIHQPPYGLLDRLEGQGPAGSMGIRQYLEEAKPMAVLCGHIHHRWGAVRLGKTWCLNPSNFGAVVEVSKVRKGGYFLDLGLDSKGVSWAMIRRLWADRILDVVHYEPRGEKIREVILDEACFRALGGQVSRPRHTEPFVRLQQIRRFFLSHETPQSKLLLRQLRAVYRSLETKGVNVGFDVLGSLGLGMAVEGSDMDLVVYLRGLGCDPDDEDICRIPEPLSWVMKELAERGVKADICDSIDLDRVEEAIKRKDKKDTQLQRFIFYRALCRPVNLRLIKELENKLMGEPGLRRSVEKKLQEHLRILVSSGRHLESWQKYTGRLRDRGLEMPPKIQEAIRAYLGL